MPPSFACLGPKRKDRIFDCGGECDIQSMMNAMLPFAELKPHKLTVDDLLLLDRGGAFVGMPRVELLDGTLYEMSPQTSPHVLVRNRLTFRLQSRIVDLALGFEALSEATIKIDPTHAPEPDIVITSVARVDGYYPASLIMLAVEVAVSSVRNDKHYKKMLYAAAGISEYWVVDVEAKTITQFWSAQGDAYENECVVAFGERLTSTTIPGLQIETDRLI
jgi:Uma2 family endonuclease